MQLITYADRLGGDLPGLKSLLRNEFEGLFAGVHILPFFDPIDGADAGFDPVDHTTVDARIGDWGDIAGIAADHSVMADLIVNHVSADSPQFKDVLRRGTASRYWDLFLKKDDIFPADSEPGPESYTAMSSSESTGPDRAHPSQQSLSTTARSIDFWTTFSAKQLDINVEGTGRAAPTSTRSCEQFAEAGVREIRLDAAGYAIKRRGTTLFHAAGDLRLHRDPLGARHAALGIDRHWSRFTPTTRRRSQSRHSVGRVYDFALPPLVLHTLYHGRNAAALKRLARRLRRRNCVTVLDTHDGIGIIDVGPPRRSQAGLLADDADRQRS